MTEADLKLNAFVGSGILAEPDDDQDDTFTLGKLSFAEPVSNKTFEPSAEYTPSVRTPTPIDLPPLPDFSQLPHAVLHSGTVETLLGLNEELMARLKVNIRRNGLLEQSLLAKDQERAEVERQRASLEAQNEILREKDRHWRERTSRAEINQSGLNDEVGLMKMRVASLEERNRILLRADRFQRRVRAWVRPFIDRLTSELRAARKSLLAKEALLSDARAQLSEAVQHAQSLEAKFTRDQSRLVEAHEARTKTITSELKKLTDENKILREKSAQIDRALSTEASSINKIVALERRVEDLTRQLETAQKELRSRNDGPLSSLDLYS